ncbi:hypothetical protein EES43_17200 [Streptomyces sp. ADI96-02]|nr:hypothetical protein EES43_17200 [Streptomyces sp. ADI96-02]
MTAEGRHQVFDQDRAAEPELPAARTLPPEAMR